MSIFAILLFVFFLILQSTDVIDWSMWFVSAPLWGWPFFVVCIGLEQAILNGSNNKGEK